MPRYGKVYTRKRKRTYYRASRRSAGLNIIRRKAVFTQGPGLQLKDNIGNFMFNLNPVFTTNVNVLGLTLRGSLSMKYIDEIVPDPKNKDKTITTSRTGYARFTMYYVKGPCQDPLSTYHNVYPGDERELIVLKRKIFRSPSDVRDIQIFPIDIYLRCKGIDLDLGMKKGLYFEFNGYGNVNLFYDMEIIVTCAT